MASNLSFSIGMQFNPEINPQKLAEMLNVIIKEMKSKLGALGNELDLIDGDSMAKELDKIKAKYKDVEDGANKTKNENEEFVKSIKGATSEASVLGKAFAFNQIAQSITLATSALGAFTQPFADLDAQVKNIGTLGVKNFEEFSGLAIEMSKSVPDSAANIAGAAYQAISAGISGTNQEIASFVEQAAKVGVAGLASTEDAVNGLTSVMNAYKIGVDGAGTVSDTFFAGIKLGKTSFNEMNAALANVIPAASAAGVKFDEVTASIAQMTALGVPTSQASTQIRAALIELQKPAKPLADAMEKAGLSAATMGQTLKEQGLIATLQQLQKSASSSGLSLTQIFGSSEAASAGLLLTGDNAERAIATLEGVRKEIEAGASTEAYNVAADSINVKTQIIGNQIQALFSGVFESLGSGAITAIQSINQVAPALAGLGGIAAIIPPGFGKSIADSSKSILGRLVPALITTSATSGATAISFGAMWTALTGPVGIVLASLAAVGTAIYFLADYLHESTTEKLESAKADEEMIAGQQKVNQAEQNSLKSKQDLIDSYKELSSKTNLTGYEQEKLKDTITQLNEVYPNAINSTKSFEENLRSLEEASANDTQRLTELQEEMKKLDEDAKKATIKRVELEVDVKAEELQDQILDEIDNIFGGNSDKQKNAVEEYIKGITEVANPQEAERALLKLNTALYNNPLFKDIPPDVRKSISEKGQQVVDATVNELGVKAEQATEKVDDALNKLYESGVTDLSKLTDSQRAELLVQAEIAGLDQKDMQEKLDGIAKTARDSRLGEIISESTQIQGNIKGAENLDELVNSYKNAGSEIEKAQIGAQIQKIAPEAVNATGKIKDANGELITSYGLVESKIDEAKNKQIELNSSKLNENQKEYLDSIDAEGEKIKDNTAKMEELHREINRKSKMGADTTELENQYKNLKSENDKYINDVASMGAEWINAGLSSEEMMKKVVDATGLSVDEAEKLVNNMLEAKKAVEDTESAVKSLGDVFSEDLKAAGEEFNTQLKELTGLERKRREARASGNKQAIKEADAEYKAQLRLTKEANSQLKSLENTKKSQEDLFKEKKVTGETQYQIATKQLKQEETSIKNSLEQFKIQQELVIATEGRKKTTEDDLVLKRRQLQAIEDEKKKILELFKVTESADGSIDVGIRAKAVEKEEVRNKINDINNQIAKENVGLVQLNSTLNIEEKELQKKIDEHERKNLEYQVELGLRPRFDLVGALESDLTNVAKEIQEKSKKVKALNEIKVSGTITEQQKAELKKLESEIIESENKQIEIKKSIRSEYSTIYDEELTELKSKHDKELSEVESRLEEEARLRDVIVSTTTDIATSDIDSEYDKRISRLESLKEAQIISEEAFNRRKEDLELEHQKKLQVIQEQSIGVQLEAQRQADLEKLEQKKVQLLAELEIERERASKLKDDTRLKELEASLGTIEGQIAEKGDIITSLASNLQGNITEIFSSITGNEEQMKEPWRKAFSVIAGALKQLASSAITTMILGQLKINAAAGGLASLILVPAITGLVNAGVNSILNPILSSILSFHTGGRVDEPTLAVVGDAKLARPGSNSEWILRDDQLKLVMRMVVSEFHNDLVNLLSNTKNKSNVDIKELNKSIVSQTMYEFSKSEISDNSEVYNKLLENIEKKDYNIVGLFKDIINETKVTNKDILNEAKIENIINHVQKEFTIDRQIEHIRSTFIEGVYEVSKELSSIKQIFKENTFNFDNFNDFIQSHNKLKRTQNEYISNKIAVPDFQEIKTQTLLKVNSYASGSPFLNTPELAIIGDAGKKNPEVVLNSPQLEEIMRKATSSSNEALTKKLDEVINAINGLDVTIADESIIKTINRKAQESRKRTRVN